MLFKKKLKKKFIKKRFVKKRFKRKFFFNKRYKRIFKRKWRRFFTRKKIRWRRRRFRYKKMVVFAYLKKRFFIWKKKKKKKKSRYIHNFFFLCTEKPQWKADFTRRWLKVQLRRRRSLDVAKEIEDRFDVYRFNVKARYPSKLKNRFKKRQAFIFMLKRRYRLKNKSFLKNYFKSLRFKRRSVVNFFFFFESQLATICLRFHFFWKLHKSYFWISQGLISVNNLLINKSNKRVKVNDFIKIVGPHENLWRYRLMKSYGLRHFHPFFYISLNYSELVFRIMSGIVIKIPSEINDVKFLLRKKRKHWYKYKNFLYLYNSFY